MNVFQFVALLDYQQLKDRDFFFYLKSQSLGYFREPNNPHPSPSSPSKVALLIAQTVEQLLSGGGG